MVACYANLHPGARLDGLDFLEIACVSRRRAANVLPGTWGVFGPGMRFSDLKPEGPV